MKYSLWSRGVLVLFGLFFAEGCTPNLFIHNYVATPLADFDEDTIAKQFQTSSNRTVLYIFRENPRGWAPFKMKVLIDKTEIAATDPGTFIRIELVPGSHEIISRTKADSIVRIQGEPGRIYFLRQSPTMKWWVAKGNLELVNDDLGHEGVMKSRLVQVGQ